MNTQRVGADGHSMLLVILIITRCLIWSGDATAWDNLLWLWLVMGAVFYFLCDVWRGRITEFHYGMSGVCAALLLLVLIPAALRAPYQSTGMGLWGMAIMHLAFAAYVMQVARGRERVIFAALCAGLLLQCLTALAQWLWVFPAMQNALAQGHAETITQETAQGDLAERLANGGLFGTFTLANTLAAFLLLAAVPLLSIIRKSSGTQRNVLMLFLFIIGVVALGTASKGAFVAGIFAAAITCAGHVTSRWRFIPLFGCIAGGVAVWIIPACYALIQPSVAVRAGYWSGAWELWLQAPLFGQGLTAFHAYGAAVMPLTAEISRYVHNDALEILLSGGIIAALALGAWWWAQIKIPFSITVCTASRDHAAITTRAAWMCSWPLFIAFLFFSAVGMLSSNTSWWPGGGDATWWLWPIIYAGLAIAVVCWAVRLPLPAPWAVQLALSAFFLHCLIDFHLQSPALWGTIIIVSVLAFPLTQQLAQAGRVPFPNSVWSRVIVSGFSILLLSGLLYGTQRAIMLGYGHALSNSLSATTTDDERAQICQLQWRIASTWPVDPSLALKAAHGAPLSHDHVALVRTISAAFPWDGQIHEIVARQLFAQGYYAEAINEMQAGVATTPALIPRRKRFIILLENALAKQPAQESWKTILAHERAFVAEWETKVYKRNQ
jgi:hypothetical protein